MLNIDLISDIPISVQVSYTPTTVTRVGDVVLLSVDPSLIAPLLESRPPWQEIFEAYDWHVDHGIFINYKANNTDSIITLSSKKWDIGQLFRLSDQEFVMALIQNDANDNYQAAVINSCLIVGSEIDGNNLSLSVRSEKCEMVYGR